MHMYSDSAPWPDVGRAAATAVDEGLLVARQVRYYSMLLNDRGSTALSCTPDSFQRIGRSLSVSPQLTLALSPSVIVRSWQVVIVRHDDNIGIISHSNHTLRHVLMWSIADPQIN
jgi:hypothetical protein